MFKEFVFYNGRIYRYNTNTNTMQMADISDIPFVNIETKDCPVEVMAQMLDNLAEMVEERKDNG